MFHQQPNVVFMDATLFHCVCCQRHVQTYQGGEHGHLFCSFCNNLINTSQHPVVVKFPIEANQLPQLTPQPMVQHSNISGPTESSAPTLASPLHAPSPHQGHGDSTPGMPISVAQTLHIHEEPPTEVGERNYGGKPFSSSCLPQEQASADAGTEISGTQNLPVSAEALRSPPQLLESDAEGVHIGINQPPGAGTESETGDRPPNNTGNQTPEENDARDQPPGASGTGDRPPNDAGGQPAGASGTGLGGQLPGVSGTGGLPPNDAVGQPPSAGADNDKCCTGDQPLVSMCTVVVTSLFYVHV